MPFRMACVSGDALQEISYLDGSGHKSLADLYSLLLLNSHSVTLPLAGSRMLGNEVCIGMQRNVK